MIKKKKFKESNQLEIDLTGPDGNAFVLLGYAKRLGRELGLDVAQIQSEMMSGDYENLVNVFDKNFGEFVTLYR
jgi:hypothetical protein